MPLVKARCQQIIVQAHRDRVDNRKADNSGQPSVTRHVVPKRDKRWNTIENLTVLADVQSSCCRGSINIPRLQSFIIVQISEGDWQVILFGDPSIVLNLKRANGAVCVVEHCGVLNILILLHAAEVVVGLLPARQVDNSPQQWSELVVRAITKRRFAGCFAAAKEQFFVLFSFEFHRREARFLV